MDFCQWTPAVTDNGSPAVLSTLRSEGHSQRNGGELHSPRGHGTRGEKPGAREKPGAARQKDMEVEEAGGQEEGGQENQRTDRFRNERFDNADTTEGVDLMKVYFKIRSSIGPFMQKLPDTGSTSSWQSRRGSM